MNRSHTLCALYTVFTMCRICAVVQSYNHCEFHINEGLQVVNVSVG